ncbi:MAG TPA: hypothetical protein VG871_23920 [Vicinamibacterales bacterium]|nr:hypothetical protein [Vicinamibacterales bacterium]
MRTLSFALMLILAGFGARPAHADEPPLARPTSAEALDHLEKGKRFYDVRDFEKAAEEYKAGALVEDTPIFEYNLGQCYRQLGDYKSAIWYYLRFLGTNPAPGPRTDAVKKFIDQMQAELDKKAMQEPPVEAATGSAAPVAAPRPLPTAPPAAAAPSEPPRWYEDGIGWGLAGGGIAGLVVGGALLADGYSVGNDANRTPDQAEAKSLHDEAGTRELAGAIVTGVGGALLVGGIIKLAIHPTGRSGLAWNVGVGPGTVLVFGHF